MTWWRIEARGFVSIRLVYSVFLFVLLLGFHLMDRMSQRRRLRPVLQGLSVRRVRLPGQIGRLLVPGHSLVRQGMYRKRCHHRLATRNSPLR